MLRDFYKDSEWLRELESLKKLHPQDFKEQMQTQPVNLTEEQKEISSYIYTAIAKSLLENDSYQNKRIDQKLAKLYQNIIIFGKGAREHALAKYISRQKGVNKVYVIPGNPGMSEQKISTLDIVFDDYAHFCQHKNISWAIIGPEDLLKKGLSDLLNQNNIPCFAPSKIASELETSKAFSKKLMQKYQIPTASFETFKNIDSATSYIRSQSFEKIVVKQSSLAAGKGVIICESKTDAIKAAQELLRVDTEIVIEEFLTGREVSLFVLCHGVHFQILGDACDYKRLLDQDKGPNTGGMGCYSPAYWLEKSQLEDIKQTIIKPTLSAMMSEQRSFKGMLFIGLMMTDEGPKVLEYNTRFGDPETQTLLPRVRSGLFEVMRSIAFDDLDEFKKAKITLDPQYSLHVVKAAKGYPGIHEKICSGDIIENKYIRNSHSEIFFAGVAAKDEILLTSGGRILGLTSLGCDLKTAREQVYAEISKITFKGEQFRGDIGL